MWWFVALALVVGLFVFAVVPAAYVAGQRDGIRRATWVARSRSAGHRFRPLAPGETPGRPAGFGQVEDANGRPAASGGPA